MKHLNLLFTLSFLFLTGQSIFAQDDGFTSELPEVRHHFLCEINGKMIYYVKNNIGYTGFSRFEYFIVDTENPSAKRELVKTKIEIGKGEGVAEFVQEYQGVIYEIYDIKTLKFNNLGSCIIRRDANTFEQIGDIIEFKDLSYLFAKVDENGIYYLTNNELFRFDHELKQLWSKKFDLLEEVGVKLNSIEIDENLNVLMAISITEQVKSKFFGTTPPAKSALMFIITDLLGESEVVIPQIPKDMSVRFARFNYSEVKKELTGVFILTSSRPTYIHVKWSVDGNILSTVEHKIGKEVVEDETNTEYAAFYKINLERVNFMTISYDVSMRYLADGSFFFIQKNMDATLEGYRNAKMMYLISPSGELVWSKVVPYNGNGIYRQTDYYIHKGEIHLLLNEFTESYASGSYQLKKLKSPVNGKTVLMCDRVFDLKTGDEISNKPLVANPSDRFIPTKVIYNKEDKVIIRYSNTIKNLEQFYTIPLGK